MPPITPTNWPLLEKTAIGVRLPTRLRLLGPKWEKILGRNLNRTRAALLELVLKARLIPE